MHHRVSGIPQTLSALPTMLLAAALSVGIVLHDAHAQSPAPEPFVEPSTPEPFAESPTPEPSAEPSTPEPSAESPAPEPPVEPSTPEPSAESPAPEPFKVASIHFQTNASACNMGIQIRFDTDGITSGSVTNPNGATIHSFESIGSLEATRGQTAGFLTGIRPQITELASALNCAPATEGQTTFADLFAEWPAGDYTFEGEAEGAKFEAKATLTHFIPAGPEIVAPAEGSTVPEAALVIQWNVVTDAILTDNPNLGPVDVVGYHVHVEESAPDVAQTSMTIADVPDVEPTPAFDIDVDGTQTSVTIPEQFLNPNTMYRLEVVAIDQSGNRTISEGSFCTTGVAACGSEVSREVDAMPATETQNTAPEPVLEGEPAASSQSVR